MKIIIRKNPEKLFEFGRILEFILGISNKDETHLDNGFLLRMHFLNVINFSVNAVHYSAFLYPRYQVIKKQADLIKKKSKLKITVTPSKQMIDPVYRKSFVHSEGKKLI